MIATWPTNTTDITDQIRDAIGRNITIYTTISGIPCTFSGDSLNPVTNLSTNQYCPVCGGNYWLETISGVEVLAHIRTRQVDTPVFEVGGYLVDGDALVQFKHTVANMEYVNNSSYFVVDNREYIKKAIDLRGVPEINRILVTLQEKEGE